MHVITTIMKKSALLLFITCLLFLNAVAQKRDIYFFKNNGDTVSMLDSADYFRVVQEPEEGSSLYSTKEFYSNKKIKSIGYSSRIYPPVYDGQYMSFYMNGNKKQVLNYANGKIIDIKYDYYPNGRLYCSLDFGPESTSPTRLIKTMKDSTGKELVTEGNGHAVYYERDFRHIREEGDIKNNKPEGKWSGEVVGKDTLTYKEIYADGKLLSGESTDGKGNVYHYTALETVPEYKGGMKLFYDFLKRELKYPYSNAGQIMQDVVWVKFTVLKNGKLSNLHVERAGNRFLDAEVIRAIGLSGNWLPATKRGRPVDAYPFTMPVNFNIANVAF